MSDRKPIGDSGVFWDLKRYGPMTGGELEMSGGMGIEQRLRYDIRKFHPRPTPGGTHSCFGPTKCVYYLNEYHDPKDVIRKWLDTNRRPIEKSRHASIVSMTHHLSGDFQGAWQEIRNDGEVDWINGDRVVPRSYNGGRLTRDKTCPYCGEEGIEYAWHIPECSET